MTDQRDDTEREDIEREVMEVCQMFRATLLRIAERATHEAVQSTLRRAQIIVSLAPQTRDAQPDDERSPPPRSPPRMTRHEAQTRILQRVRDAPGSNTKELAQSLGLTRGRLRYHLKLLTENGTLEFRDICPKRNFVQQRQYFCRAEDGAQRHGAVAAVPPETSVGGLP